MQPIPIREPCWNAGQEFKWDKQYSQTGIPIPTVEVKKQDGLVRGDNYLYVRVKEQKEIWAISKFRAKSIVNRYNSRKRIDNIDVCVIPWEAFQKV